MRFSIMLVLAAAATSSAVYAEEAAKKDKDPDELICRYERKPGTRLVTTKRCLTRAQWADMQRQNRLAIDIAQTTRYKSF
jgi:hypothetical protein